MGAPSPPEFNIDYLASAIEYAADNGANVISISTENIKHKPKLKDAVDYAYGKGVVLVHPAGNSGTSDEFYPGAYENVIAVGGTDHKDDRMNYYDSHYGAWIRSTYGPWLDVAAPGELVYTTTPTYHVPANDLGFKQNYDYGTGTSASAPIVAGVAALLLSQDPSLTNDEVMKIIRANVDPYISEEYLGTGRINAHKALTRFNGQPDVPVTPTGEMGGRTGRQYTYATSASDPDGDQLYYIWDWGDGNYSEPLGPFESGEVGEADYAWGHDGNYSIRVKAVDIKGGESYWSDPVIVSMPKNRILNFHPLLLQFLENHPHLFPILRQILLYLG